MRRSHMLVLALAVALGAPSSFARSSIEDSAAATSPDAAREALTLTIGADTLHFARIGGGTFSEGSPATDPNHQADENARDVILAHAYYMQTTPVTRGLYAAFVAETGYRTEAERGESGGSGWNGTELSQKKEFTWRTPGFAQTDQHPVVLVTYADAISFTAWASAKSGRTVRLPTEAEYEFALRAGTTTAWYGGDSPSAATELGWFKSNAGDGTRPVAQKAPNAFGLYDMAGNVYEWCTDVYAPYDAQNLTDPEAKTPGAGEPLRRVLRGGSWLKDPKHGRSAARYRNTPGSRNADNGFRVVVAEGNAAKAAPTASAPLFNEPDPGPTLGPRAPNAGVGLMILVPLLFFGGVVLAVVLLLIFGRRKRAGGGGVPGADAVQTRAAADGFYVLAPGLAPGSRVRYECIVNGMPVSDVIPTDGGPETFVYTGGTPSAIRILEVVAVRAAGYRGPVIGARPVHPPTRRQPDAPEPFVGYPRAY